MKNNPRDMLLFERMLAAKGLHMIAGVDEAGRGPLAGPVAAAAVILNPDDIPEGADDSKKLSPRRREELYDIIYKKALAVSVTMVDNTVIDDINILQATMQAMNAAIDGLKLSPDYILVDGDRLPRRGSNIQAIVGGDAKSASIACASIIAKVTRDRLMLDYARQYPGYGFERHMGYGTKQHRDALLALGMCPIHRHTFCKKLLGPQSSGGLRAVGTAGEDIAEDYARSLGYNIIARNFKAAGGEIDIIARDGDCMVFIEVKTRSGTAHGTGQEALTAKKAAALHSAELAYMAANGLCDAVVRNDVIAINQGKLTHIKNAF